LGQLAWSLFAASFVAGACGNKDDAPPTTTGGTGIPGAGGKSFFGGGGKAGKGGTSGEAGSGATAGVDETGQGGEAGQPAVDPKTPVVTITSPVALTDPNAKGVITDTDIDVVCTVVQSTAPGSLPVDRASVVIQMLDSDGNAVPTSDNSTSTTYAATPTANDNEYSAHVLMNKVPDNGKVGFTCTASDSSRQRLFASSTITTFVDHGPLVTIGEPAADSAHRLNGTLDVDFTVAASLLASNDKNAAVSKVTLEVQGVPFDLTQQKDTYTASVALSDPTLFATTPSGDTPITIHAIDKRGAGRVESYSFKVDGDGPEIAIMSPANSDVVGGRVPLVFTVTDAISGVDQKSVDVILNDVDNYYGEGGEWSVLGDVYTFKFDSTQIKESKAQATINIRARDLAGNDAPGESWLLYIDNMPPIVDLDPPHVRAYTKSSTDVTCSTSFDPLGIARNDLDATNSRFAFLRALVWEETNYVTGQMFVKYAGTDDSTVKIYIQPHTDQPFLINNPKDPDLGCDDIDDSVVTANNFIQLTPVPPTGAATFEADDPNAYPPIATDGCIFGTAASEAPKLCLNQSSDLSIVIAHVSPERPPAVYALGPLVGEACTGIDWEIGAHADEGWVCLAGRAVDKAGNIGVSKPLRLCYDDPATPFVPDCMTGSTPPSCTDGCTLPPSFPGSYPGDAYVRQ